MCPSLLRQKSSTMYETERKIIGSVLFVVIVLGVGGCILSLLVWTKGRQRNTSTAKFLSALAAVDLLVLSVSAMDFFIYLIWKLSVKDENIYACKILVFIIYTLQSLSSWILVCVTVERVIGVWRPHKLKVICTKGKAYLISGVTAIVIILIYLPTVITSDLVIFGGNLKYCYVSSDPIHVETFLWMDLVILYIAPWIILLICNTLILFKIGLKQRDRKRKFVTMRRRSDKTLSAVTTRIVAMNLAFCCCNAPIVILDLIQYTSDSQVHIQHYILRHIFQLLMYINNSINFVLYSTFGTSFRQDLVDLLFPSRRRSRRLSVLSISSELSKDFPVGRRMSRY